MKFPELYQLIHTLTTREKDAIDKSFTDGGYTNTSKYYRLYKHLAVYYGSFDTARLKAFLEKNDINPGTARNYSKRIYEQSMTVLLQKKFGNDHLFVIQQHIAKARLLMQKERFDVAKTELKAARQLEEKFNHPSTRFEIEMLEARILFQKDLKTIDAPLQLHHKAARQAMANFDRDAKINLAYHELYQYGMRRKSAESEWSNFCESFDQIPYPENCNLEILFCYIAVKMKIAHWKNDLTGLLYWAEKIYLLFKNNVDYQQQFFHLYLTAIDHYLAAISLNRQFDKISAILEILENISPKEPLLITKKEGTLVFYTLTLVSNDAEAREVISPEEIERLKIKLERCYEGILPSRVLAIYFMFGYLGLLRLDYAMAEEYFDEFYIHRSNKLRPDLQRIIMLVQTLIQLDDPELAFEYIEDIIDKVNSRLFAWDGLHPYEMVAIKFFHRINKSPKEKRELHPIYEQFKEELLATADPKTGKRETGADVLIEWLCVKLKK